MENNNFNNQQYQPVQPQTQYQQPVQQYQPVQPYYQPVQTQPMQSDPFYEVSASRFLKCAILNLVFCGFPIGSIICMITAKKIRNELLEYVAQGKPHTDKIKTSSALLRAAGTAGLAYTIFWGVYLLYIILLIGTMV